MWSRGKAGCFRRSPGPGSTTSAMLICSTPVKKRLASAGTASEGSSSPDLGPRLEAPAAPSDETALASGALPHMQGQIVRGVTVSALRCQLVRGCGSCPAPVVCIACTVLHQRGPVQRTSEKAGDSGWRAMWPHQPCTLEQRRSQDPPTVHAAHGFDQRCLRCERCE